MFEDFKENPALWTMAFFLDVGWIVLCRVQEFGFYWELIGVIIINFSFWIGITIAMNVKKKVE